MRDCLTKELQLRLSSDFCVYVHTRAQTYTWKEKLNPLLGILQRLLGFSELDLYPHHVPYRRLTWSFCPNWIFPHLLASTLCLLVTHLTSEPFSWLSLLLEKPLPQIPSYRAPVSGKSPSPGKSLTRLSIPNYLYCAHTPCCLLIYHAICILQCCLVLSSETHLFHRIQDLNVDHCVSHFPETRCSPSKGLKKSL